MAQEQIFYTVHCLHSKVTFIIFVKVRNFKNALTNVLDKAFKARAKELMADDLKQDMEYLLNFLPHFMKSYK